MTKRNRNILIIGVLGVTVLLAALVMFAQGQKGEGERVFTEEVERRTIQEIVSASGKVYPQKEVKISSDVSGEIVELFVEEGDSVIAGQLLAKIDPDAYQSQVERGVAGVNSAQAQLANSRSQIESLRAQKEQIQAQLENAQDIHKRNEGLLKDGVIAESEFQQTQSSLRGLEANLRAADANIRSSQQSVKAAEFSVQSSQATLNELKTSLRRTTLYAPVSGIISLLNVEAGERVVGTIQMTGTEMMRVANLEAMEVRVEVSENDIPRVTLGDEVDIEVDAYLDRKFKGTVTQIANSSVGAGSAGGSLMNDQVTNFEVRIEINPESYKDLLTPQKPYPFRPGMSAGVDIMTNRVDQALSLPIQAVTTREPEEDKDDDKNKGLDRDLLEVVFVISGDTVMMAPVKTSVQDDRYIQIIEGLTEGQEVVTGPYTAIARKLEAGTQVRVTDEEKFYKNDDN